VTRADRPLSVPRGPDGKLAPMTGGAAGRFDEALASSPPELTGPELLPARLARACARALDVDGAGLSLHVGLLRTPIGASDAVTAHAERLQFTVGDGPCLRANDDGVEITFAIEDIQRNWPQLWAALLGDTPYRGVLSVPLPPPMGPLVVLDLYVHAPRRCPGSTAPTSRPSPARSPRSWRSR
jgi:hypothetical protein